MKKYIRLSLIALAVLANTCAFAQGRVNFIPEWDTNIPTNQRPSAVRGLVLSAVSRDATVGLARAADNRFYLWDLQKRRVLPTRLIS